MAESAGWAVITYWELLEQRTSLMLENSSCGQAFVVGVRIHKVTGTGEPELEGGCFFAGFGESPFQLEDGLLGSVIKMLTNV